MEQKEVLIIVGVLVAGFFLLKGSFSGNAVSNDNIISSPQGYEQIQTGYQGGSAQGLSTSETLGCPDMQVLTDDNCADWVNNMFKCTSRGIPTPCHCGSFDSCTNAGPIQPPIGPTTL